MKKNKSKTATPIKSLEAQNLKLCTNIKTFPRRDPRLQLIIVTAQL